MASRPDVRARHRARRRSTRRRILDTALALLEERRWHELTPELVMTEAGLTRTAFYRHFASHEALLVALLEDLGLRLEDLLAAWERGRGPGSRAARGDRRAHNALRARWSPARVDRRSGRAG